MMGGITRPSAAPGSGVVRMGRMPAINPCTPSAVSQGWPCAVTALALSESTRCSVDWGWRAMPIPVVRSGAWLSCGVLKGRASLRPVARCGPVRLKIIKLSFTAPETELSPERPSAIKKISGPFGHPVVAVTGRTLGALHPGRKTQNLSYLPVNRETAGQTP